MLGIGVTTYNRYSKVINTLEKIQEHTKKKYELVVCDDGSTDGTAEKLRNQGYSVISGGNRGVAWNKNRALHALFKERGCSTVILLEDDTSPNANSWEDKWCDAAERYGHANLAGWWFISQIAVGKGTPSDPYQSTNATAQCSVFSRKAWSRVGYMDTRFGTYGFEHVEHTYRMVRAGYGGKMGNSFDDTINYLLSGSDLTVDCLNETVNAGNQEHNGWVFINIRDEDVHRPAWRNKEEKITLQTEMATCRPSLMSRIRAIKAQIA